MEKLEDIKFKKEALELSIKAKNHVKKADVIKNIKASAKEFKENLIFIASETSTNLEVLSLVCDDLIEEIIKGL